MKKFLLFVAVAIIAVSANAQKSFTLNVEPMMKKTANVIFTDANQSVVANKVARPNLAAKKADAAVVNLLEIDQEKTDGAYEDKETIFMTSNVEYVKTGKTGEYKGQTLPMIEIEGFGFGYANVYGYIDEVNGFIYIPVQQCYEHSTYGAMSLEGLFIDENGDADWDGETDVVLMETEPGEWVTWDGTEEVGSVVGWIILMSGDYEGKIWTYGIETPLLTPNGVEHSYNTLFGKAQYTEESYPVYIEDLGDEVNIYGFGGFGTLNMLVDEADVYIPVGQAIYPLPAAAGYDTETHGEYFRNYAVGEDGYLDFDAEYSMATMEPTKISMGENGYIGIWSLFTDEGMGYKFGYTNDISWTLNEGVFSAFADAVNNVYEQKLSGNNKSYNLVGQQVAKNVKGLVIRNGKKFINK